ncbi:LysR family transcriptional regulator [Nocardioides sp. NBC_00368]|uniref:LysR family transcriptional regulator n=1 Tax=Nocardioides sp. NBC_00368 TaxID=2976000 RepID=UPI002E21F3FD
MHLPRQAPYTLRQLEYFVAVADVGTISGAAAELHVSESAIADSLSTLERSLKTSLVQRHRSRGITLTSDGIAVLSAGRRLLQGAEEIVDAVGDGVLSRTGAVRIGAIPTLAPVIVPRLLTMVAHSHPGLRPDIRTDDQPTLMAELLKGNLDLLISYDLDVSPDLSREALYQTQACVVLSSSHPFASRPHLGLEEIADEPMVLLDIAPSRTHTLELMSNAGVTPRTVIHTSNYELCRSLVGRGHGYTLLMWRDYARQTWDRSEVVFIPITPRPRMVNILALWRQEHFSGRVRAVVETLRTLSPALIEEHRFIR